MNDRDKEAAAWILTIGILAIFGILIFAVIGAEIAALLPEPQPEPSLTGGYEAKP